MKRREFITLLGGTAAWPLATRAQQPDGVRRVGVLNVLAANDQEAPLRITAFQDGLQKLGWTQNHNIRIDYRWSGGDATQLHGHAAELVALEPDVLIGVSSPCVAALRRETAKIPIVFVMVVDPVALGFVTSLVQPGGNITGFINFEILMGGKWLGMLKDLAPGISTVKVLFGSEMAPYAEQFLRSIEAAAPSFAVTATATPYDDTVNLEQTVNALAGRSDAGLIVLPDASNSVHRDLIIALASRHHLPAVYPFRYFPVSGGLMPYGSDPIHLMQQGASYVDRILRGEKSADLPVQAPTKYELVINLKTAKALGLTVPPTLLAVADEVIE